MEQIIKDLIKERDSFYKRGLELAQRKCQSDDTSELSEAFAKAQSGFGAITKDTKGYNYKFAQLDQVLNAVRPSLNKNGMSLSQHTDDNNVLYTRLRHSSGQWIESRVTLPEVGADNKRSLEQAWGSTFTYMRRYQILALLGIHPETDTDGAK